MQKVKKFLCIGLIILAVGGLISCRREKAKPGVSMEPDWYRYISAHTSGTVPRRARIRVFFVEEVGRPGEEPAALCSR
ncbi:MAG: hypothetical protein WBI18_01785 [Candidatus Saccharicenans sp.]